MTKSRPAIRLGPAQLGAVFWVAFWTLNSTLAGCSRDSSSSAQRAPDANTTTNTTFPSIQVDSRAHDFGILNDGATPEHVFLIRNTGTAPLVISGVNVSCGCTVASLKGDTIAPGKAEPLKATLTSRGFPGETRVALTVVSNDPNHLESVLEPTAIVENLLNFERQYLYSSTTVGADKVEQVWLTGRLVDQARLKVTKLEGEPDLEAAVIHRKHGRRDRQGIKVRLKAGRVSQGGGHITLSTGIANPTELTVEFTYLVQARTQTTSQASSK